MPALQLPQTAPQQFLVPPKIIEQYNRLYRLIEDSPVGHVDVKSLAEYCGRTPQWIANLACTGRLPYAFASPADMGRRTVHISPLALYAWELQGLLGMGHDLSNALMVAGWDPPLAGADQPAKGA